MILWTIFLLLTFFHDLDLTQNHCEERDWLRFLSPPPQIRIMGKVGHWAVSGAQPPPLTLLSGLISSRGATAVAV